MKPGFDASPVREGFVGNEGFLQVPLFYRVIYFTPLLHILISCVYYRRYVIMTANRIFKETLHCLIYENDQQDATV